MNTEALLCEVARQVEVETEMKVHFMVGGPFTNRGGDDAVITYVLCHTSTSTGFRT